MLITRYGLRLNKPFIRPTIRPFSISSIIKSHKGSFRTSEDQIDTNDITTDNNPYSPTLYDDKVFVLKPNNFFKTQLPDNYRLSYLPLYESPGAKYVSLLKRLTISFGVLGIYGAKLFFQSDSFDDLYGYIVMATTSLPAILVQYKTRDYVTRIFRLYDKNKPQTLENLINNEQLIMEKLNILGGTTFNELLTITNNKSLKLSSSKYKLLKPYSTWEEIDPETKRKRKYFVVDNIGGIKMDRVWGIIEKNSGINNGRSDY